MAEQPPHQPVAGATGKGGGEGVVAQKSVPQVVPVTNGKCPFWVFRCTIAGMASVFSVPSACFMRYFCTCCDMYTYIKLPVRNSTEQGCRKLAKGGAAIDRGRAAVESVSARSAKKLGPLVYICVYMPRLPRLQKRSCPGRPCRPASDASVKKELNS